jgi:low affinity Fe/Cu permease
LDELIKATDSRKDVIGIEEKSEPELKSKREEVDDKEAADSH